MNLILGVPSISILSRDPNLVRRPSKTKGGTDPVFEKNDGWGINDWKLHYGEWFDPHPLILWPCHLANAPKRRIRGNCLKLQILGARRAENMPAIG